MLENIKKNKETEKKNKSLPTTFSRPNKVSAIPVTAFEKSKGVSRPIGLNDEKKCSDMLFRGPSIKN